MLLFLSFLRKVFPAIRRKNYRVGRGRYLHRLGRDVFPFAKWKRKKIAWAVKAHLEIPPGIDDLRLQLDAIARTAIKMGARVAAKFDVSPAPVLDLVPGKGEKALRPGCQIVRELLVQFNLLSGKKQRDLRPRLLGHCTQSDVVIAVAVVKGEYECRYFHSSRTQ